MSDRPPGARASGACAAPASGLLGRTATCARYPASRAKQHAHVHRSSNTVWKRGGERRRVAHPRPQPPPPHQPACRRSGDARGHARGGGGSSRTTGAAQRSDREGGRRPRGPWHPAEAVKKYMRGCPWSPFVGQGCAAAHPTNTLAQHATATNSQRRRRRTGGIQGRCGGQAKKQGPRHGASEWHDLTERTAPPGKQAARHAVAQRGYVAGDQRGLRSLHQSAPSG